VSRVFTRIRWRLVGWNLLVLGAILALVGGVIYSTLGHALMSQVDAELARHADRAARLLREAPMAPPWLGREGYRGGLFFLVVGPRGEALANPQSIDLSTWTIPAGVPARGVRLRTRSEAPPAEPVLVAAGVGAVLDELAEEELPRYATITIDDTPTRLYLRRLNEGPVPGAVLVVGQSVAAEQEVLRSLLLVLLAGGGAGLLCSLAGAWILAGRALVPIQRAFSRQQEFVAAASHELRTPLTVLRSATDLLHRHRAEPLEANGELFDDMRQELARMERLANDLLTLARSDLGELDLAAGELDLAALAGDVVRRTAPLARERGIALTCQGGGDHLVVEGDPDLLQQVLLILLDNALKHTPRGGSVTVATRRQGMDALLEVRDTGEGIPPEHLPRVCDPFYRVDRARSRSAGGAGLGLAIARTLVDAHGGQLGLSSTVGVGTTVTIRLPLAGQAPSLANRLGQLAGPIARRHARRPAPPPL